MGKQKPIFDSVVGRLVQLFTDIIASNDSDEHIGDEYNVQFYLLLRVLEESQLSPEQIDQFIEQWKEVWSMANDGTRRKLQRFSPSRLSRILKTRNELR